MSNEYHEYQVDQYNLEDYDDQRDNCNCFSLFKSKRTFEDGISTTAYTPYIPQIKEIPCIPDYSNPIAQYYQEEFKPNKKCGRCRICSIIINIFF